MDVITADLPRDLDHIEIHIFSDWHIGDVNCKMDEIKAEIEEVGSSRNAYCICNGDLINNATKASVSDMYAETMTPQEQIDLLCELLDPIKDKILMITRGNHEARTNRESGIDLSAVIANMLGCIERYSQDGGVLFVKFGHQSSGHKDYYGKVRRQTYSMYVTHGAGGGRKEGAKAIRLADMAAIVDTDIYVHSHTHLPMVMKQAFFRVDRQKSRVASVEKLFVNSSAKLGYGGYGQSKEFKPNSTSSPVILLNGSRREIGVRM